MEQPATAPCRPRNPLAALWRDPVLLTLDLVMAGALLGYGFHLGGPTAQVLVCWGLMAVLHLALMVMSCRVSGQVNGPPAVRVWRAMAFAGLAYLIGDLLQLQFIATHPLSVEAAIGSPLQSLTVLIGTAAPVLVMLVVPIGHRSSRERIRFWLDVSVVLAATMPFGSYAYVPVSSGEAVAVIIGVMIGPGIFLVAVFAVTKLILGAEPPFTRAAGATLATAAGVEAIAQAMGYALVGMRELAWQFSLTLVASSLLAGVPRVQQVQISLGSPRPVRAGRTFSLLPYLALAASWAFLIGLLAGIGLNPRTWLALAGVVVATALVVVRQWLAFTENALLVEQLASTVRHLHDALGERDQLASQLRFQALHDPLTGLANRTLFRDRLDEAIRSCGRRGPRPIVMVVDLDDFKPVNDRYGHAAGDELLISAGARLRDCLRGTDVVARLGGDEFALLVRSWSQEAGPIAHRVIAALSGPFQLAAGEVSINASVGVVTVEPGESVGQVLHAADVAMYLAKRAGKGHYRIYARQDDRSHEVRVQGRPAAEAPASVAPAPVAPAADAAAPEVSAPQAPAPQVSAPDLPMLAPRTGSSPPLAVPE